ncbi:MAG TPA: VCBS repeat-containing protein [Longimicrobiales bacterium]|nr:VCBS repeat-containing protein [Longimicrobiales bacterium]
MIIGGILPWGCAEGDVREGADGGPRSAGGARSFARSLALEDTAVTSANVSLGDVNGDGHLDVVLVRGRHWPLDNLLRLGDGQGGFAPAVPLGAPADRSYSGVLVDLDGDGDLDVVVSNDDPDPKRVLLNDGSGRFALGSTFGRGEWATRHVRVADLNGDGRPDAVLANRYGSETGPSFVCFGTDDGGFEDGCEPVTQGSATTIAPADIDGDGDVDLVVPHRDQGQGFVYLNDGRGAFPERRPFGPANAAIRSAEAADLDGDGVQDLVVIDERTGPAVFWGAADGTWPRVTPLVAPHPTEARPYALYLADVDEDGRTDVLVGYVEARPVVFFNDGPEVLTPVAFGDAEGAVYGFAVGDLDEDGRLDIALARSGARNMVYFGAVEGAEGR